MELNKAIEHLKDQCKFGLSRLFTENDILAINTVLEELNNRIPRKDIEFIVKNNKPHIAQEKLLELLEDRE